MNEKLLARLAESKAVAIREALAAGTSLAEDFVEHAEYSQIAAVATEAEEVLGRMAGTIDPLSALPSEVLDGLSEAEDGAWPHSEAEQVALVEGFYRGVAALWQAIEAQVA